MDSKNNVREFRQGKMLSKAELARLAGISPLTVDRVERGMPCRIATRRKMLSALGLKLSQKGRLFKD
jgi:DNA-binding XRE family transcriptional regulator